MANVVWSHLAGGPARRWFFLVGLWVTFGLCSTSSQAQVLTRDPDFGRISVQATSEYYLYENYGYASAQDRLWQLEINRRTAKGAVAEVLGRAFLPQDRQTRREGYTVEEYRAAYDAMPDWVRLAVQAYTDGVNRYLREAQSASDRPAWIPWEFYYLGYMPQPWDVTDSMAILRTFLVTFGESNARQLSNLSLYRALVERYGEARAWAIFNDLHWMNDPDSPVTAPPGDPDATPVPVPAAKRIAWEVYAAIDIDAVRSAAEAAAQEAAEVQALRSTLGFPPKLGSYAYVVNGEKSASGKPLLFGGPQMLIYPMPDIVHDVYLKTLITPFNLATPRINVAGISAAGGPLVVIGHTDRTAWTITSGIGNNIDTFIETVRPHPSTPGAFQYFFKGRWRDIEQRTELFKIRTSAIPGPLVADAEEQTIYYRTVHGPVFQPPVLTPTTTVAFTNQRAHWKKEAETLVGLMGINRATNLEQVEENVKRLNSSLNIIYADIDGNIAYWQAGRIPVRAAGADVRLPMRGTGEDEWEPRYLPLPHAVNPRQGYLANWNNKPAVWFDTNGETPFGKQFRVSRILDLLQDPTRIADRPAGGDPVKLSPADFRAIEREISRVPPTGYRRPFAVDFLSRAINDLDDRDGRKTKLKAAGERLQNWHGYYIDDPVNSEFANPGELLFTDWVNKALAKVFGPWLGNEAAHASFNALIHVLEGRASAVPPNVDYFGDRSWKTILTDSLWEAMTSLADRYHSEDPDQWKLPRSVLVFPHTLCLANRQVCAVGPPVPASNRSTYSQLVHLSTPVQGMNVIPSGQSGFLRYDPADIQTPILGPHTTDQRGLFKNFDFKPMLLR